MGDDRQVLRIVVQPVHRRGREVGGGRLHALAHCFSAALFFSDLRALYLLDRRFSVKYPSSDVVTCPTESN